MLLNIIFNNDFYKNIYVFLINYIKININYFFYFTINFIAKKI